MDLYKHLTHKIRNRINDIKVQQRCFSIYLKIADLCFAWLINLHIYCKHVIIYKFTILINKKFEASNLSNVDYNKLY